MTDFSDKAVRLLADPTRLKIFRSVMDAREGPITVSEAAKRFDIHPNVARMHLEKLASAGLIASAYRKNGEGGRPARLYTASERAMNLQYPPRDYELLAEISLASLDEGTDIEQAARKKGRQIGLTALEQAGGKTAVSDFTASVKVFEQLAQAHGLQARIEEDGGNSIRIKIYNCVFRELSAKNEHVCEIHKNLLIGVCEALFGKAQVTGTSGLASGGDVCDFTFKFGLKKAS